VGKAHTERPEAAMHRSALPILVLLASLAFVAPLTAYSAGPPPTYVVGKIGGYFPMASDVDTFDSDFMGEVAVGYYIAPGFAVEGGIGYFETSGRMSGPPAADHTFEVYPLTFSIRGAIPYGPFEAYGLAGIGVYFVEDKRSAPGFGGSDSAADIGFHLGIGGKYTLPNNVFFGLEGRYLWLSAGTFGTDTRLDGAVLTATVGYRF
jgi:opacity protein-like surface antigen